MLYSQKQGCLLLLTILLSWGAGAQAEQAVSESVKNERECPLPRKELCKPRSPIMSYQQELTDLIIGSTPLEEGDRWAKTFKPASVAFNVNKDGEVENWKLTSLSGSVARDFWTLYAVASCPPAKPDGISTPITLGVDNVRIPLVSSKEAEDWRVQQSCVIPRKEHADYVYFSLIPASFISKFPKEIGIPDICAKRNLVGIPVSSLWKNSESVDLANQILQSNHDLSEFLGSWSKFLKKHQNPSRESILAYADSLKGKYPNLLKEGEPEAPLP